MKKLFINTALLLAICAVVTGSGMITGCATKKNIEKDAFFEKWSTMAKENQGSSPKARVRTLDIPPEEKELAQKMAGIYGRGEAGIGAPSKELPQNLITLKMRNADVATVLRALARAANQNILIKSEVAGQISVDFKKVPWNEAFLSIMRSRMLTFVWDGDIIRIATVEDLENDLRLESIREKRREQEILRSRMSPLHTIVVSIDYADALKLKDNLLEFLTKDDEGKPYGSVQVSTHTNSLIIQATRDDLKRILPMIEKIDRPTAQIRIEANIVETTRDTARSLGIQWGGLYGNSADRNNYWITPGGSTPSGSASSDPVSGGYTPATGQPGLSGQGLGVNFPIASTAIDSAGGMGSLGLMFGKIGGSILEIQLQALQSEGKLNILSSPSITTLDNQTAFTENGEKIPFVTINKDGDTEVNFEDAVLRLEITPHVIDPQHLKMKIIIKKDEVDFSRTVQGNPVIIKKQTDTSLIVSDSETIVISGLSKKREIEGDSGIPWFKDLPGVGFLFKGEDRSSAMEEVLIFITPRILRQEKTAG